MSKPFEAPNPGQDQGAQIEDLSSIPKINSDSLAARLEPFDSYWQAPENIEAGYSKFSAYYRHNYLRHLPDAKDSHILVVSCGPGYLVNLLKQEGYINVTGIDSDAEKVRFATERKLDCVAARAFEYLQDNQTEFYDVIIPEQELGHLTHAETIQFLKLCRSRLKKGGTLIAYTLNGANPLVAAENLAHNIDHFYTVTEHSMHQLMILGGFENVAVFPLKLYVFWKNPLNYVGLLSTSLFEFMFRAIYILYGKKVRILTKKIMATGTR